MKCNGLNTVLERNGCLVLELNNPIYIYYIWGYIYASKQNRAVSILLLWGQMG